MIGAAVVTALARPTPHHPPGTPVAPTPRPLKIIGALVLAAALLALYLLAFGPVTSGTMTVLTVGVTAVVLFRVTALLFRRPTTSTSPPNASDVDH